MITTLNEGKIISHYTMSPAMAKEILKTKRKKEKGDREYLCEYVNNEINPRYTCTRVFIH